MDPRFIYSLGVLGVFLYGAYIMIRKAKVDGIISKLVPKDRRQELETIAILTQEVKNAKIAYDNSRRQLDKLTGSEQVPDGSGKD